MRWIQLLFRKINSLLFKPKLMGVRPEAMEADYPHPENRRLPPYIGKHLVLSYFVPDGLMHPEDVATYISGSSKGESIYKCIAEGDFWVKISNNANEMYRINPKRAIWVPEPMYALGQAVETMNGTKRKGWVSIRCWHFKQKRFYYHISIVNTRGKRVVHKRRYWQEDLVKIAGL